MPETPATQVIDERIVLAVHRWLSERLTPVPVALDDLTAAADRLPAAMQQSLDGNPVVRRYKDGGVVLRYEFAVYVRDAVADTAARLDGIAQLAVLSRALAAGDAPTMPEGIRYREGAATSSPVRLTATDDGTDTYRGMYQITIQA